MNPRSSRGVMDAQAQFFRGSNSILERLYPPRWLRGRIGLVHPSRHESYLLRPAMSGFRRRDSCTSAPTRFRSQLLDVTLHFRTHNKHKRTEPNNLLILDTLCTYVLIADVKEAKVIRRASFKG